MPNTTFGAFILSTERRQLTREGAEVHLTPKAFDLLALLIAAAPRVVTKAEIHACLWPDTFVCDATLVGLVKEVRRALGDGDDTIIRTAHRVGYAFDKPETLASATRQHSVTCWLIDGLGERLALGDGTHVIGRAADASVWLDGPGISRHHARIVVEGGVATIEDLGSKNGTLVGGRPAVGTVPLQDGDQLRIATEVLTFRTAGGGMSTTTLMVLPDRSDWSASETLSGGSGEE
jgi:DNA-binding winged helix-turn-helix (wHTH) protein